jgi:hypothetical protein
MIISEKSVWLIMSKDRQFVAKGTPRNRELVRTDDKKDGKRFLTYTSKGRAEAGFKTSGFYGQRQLPGYSGGRYLDEWLEAVEVKMKIETVS